MSEYTKNKSGIKAWLPLILAVIYTISPVDLVPDTLPIAGWLEDILFLIVGGLNGIENGVLDDNSSVKKIIKFLKWGLLIVGIIGILIIILLAVLVFKVATN
ncbi:DUF1232 domain-containing protein [Brachyspira pilosicoli]|uniref:DUF1232 domain-containing protein n=1 Tax=Brachyspira pilosicoli TaxID=52584 RepID=UPI001CA57756|nr:DUF1232 domain-containing protein [Brachyspira pilosicoli]MBW5396768.1 DUF1232 domain-containing protein [Brachyspira pilosicoli]